MNEIIVVLNENGKMTSSQIFLSLKKTPQEVIENLKTLEKNNKVKQLNGYWFVSHDVKKNTLQPVRTLDIIKQWGVVSAAEIAFITGTSLPTVARGLSEHVKSQAIVRYRKDSTYFYKIGIATIQNT